MEIALWIGLRLSHLLISLKFLDYFTSCSWTEETARFSSFSGYYWLIVFQKKSQPGKLHLLTMRDAYAVHTIAFPKNSAFFKLHSIHRPKYSQSHQIFQEGKEGFPQKQLPNLSTVWNSGRNRLWKWTMISSSRKYKVRIDLPLPQKVKMLPIATSKSIDFPKFLFHFSELVVVHFLIQKCSWSLLSSRIEFSPKFYTLSFSSIFQNWKWTWEPRSVPEGVASAVTYICLYIWPLRWQYSKFWFPTYSIGTILRLQPHNNIGGYVCPHFSWVSVQVSGKVGCF